MSVVKDEHGDSLLAVHRKEDETLVSSCMTSPSSAARGVGMKAAIEDPRTKMWAGRLMGNQ
jgi:uncharacterized protein YbaA (DUF1428 family)